MLEPNIREFSPADIAPALDLWRRTVGIGLSNADRPENLQTFLSRNPGLSHVAVNGAGLIGTVLCGTDGRRGYIHHLAVAETSRRSGLGRALLDAALFALNRQGIQKCHAFVFQSNPFAALFWTPAGWERREELCIYSKPLSK
jgi:ribosomal protein S18 acetylase RimI-like enzyme